MALMEKLHRALAGLSRGGFDRHLCRDLLLLALVMGMGVLCCITFWQAGEARASRIHMEEVVSTYSSQVSGVNASACRAVEAGQTSEVMQDIAGKAQDYGLRVEAGGKHLYGDGSGEVYEMKLKGSWQRTAGFLEHLQPKDALLGIRMLQMKGTEGQVETELQVKIFTK